MSLRSRVLITGPGGRIGPRILPILRQEFALRLLDLKPLPAEQDDEWTLGCRYMSLASVINVAHCWHGMVGESKKPATFSSMKTVTFPATYNFLS